MTWGIQTGDNMGTWGLPRLPDNCVDAIVTDPPAGISFMGKSWDADKGGRDAWIAWLAEILRECLRVAKPGAHMFCWALPRTSHWTATAIEDAGWGIRDTGLNQRGRSDENGHGRERHRARTGASEHGTGE